MGPPQQCKVQWKTHHSVILSQFGDLYNTQSLVDVTLAAEGQYLRAHKMILSACSPYFQELLSIDHGEKSTIIFLKDVLFSELKAIIEFVYNGEIHILQDDLPSLLRVAESLKIRGLSEATVGGESKQNNYNSSTSLNGHQQQINSSQFSNAASENAANNIMPSTSTSTSNTSKTTTNLDNNSPSCSSNPGIFNQTTNKLQKTSGTSSKVSQQYENNVNQNNMKRKRVKSRSQNEDSQQINSQINLDPQPLNSNNSHNTSKKSKAEDSASDSESFNPLDVDIKLEEMFVNDGDDGDDDGDDIALQENLGTNFFEYMNETSQSQLQPRSNLIPIIRPRSSVWEYFVKVVYDDDDDKLIRYLLVEHYVDEPFLDPLQYPKKKVEFLLLNKPDRIILKKVDNFKSIVWNYFVRINADGHDTNFVLCKNCRGVFTHKNNSGTSGHYAGILDKVVSHMNVGDSNNSADDGGVDYDNDDSRSEINLGDDDNSLDPLDPNQFQLPKNLFDIYQKQQTDSFSTILRSLASKKKPIPNLTPVPNKGNQQQKLNSPIKIMKRKEAGDLLSSDEADNQPSTSDGEASNADGKYTCSTCHKTFTLKTNLTAHRKIHFGETYCTFCDKLLSTVGNLKSHLIAVHGDIVQKIPRRSYNATGAYSKKVRPFQLVETQFSEDQSADSQNQTINVQVHNSFDQFSPFKKQ